MDVSLLNAGHQRKGFQCEESSLNHYLLHQASQDIRRRLSACFVLADKEQQVIGYYTLSSQSLDRNAIPDAYRKHLPAHYEVPLILLGRLARDFRYKGQGLGEFLLVDALLRAFRVSTESIGAMAVIVEPISEQAVRFYEKFGFIMLPESGKMFLSMKVVEKLAKNME